MSLLSRLRGTSLHPAWNYRAHGALWQVQVGSPRFLFGESRDQEKKSVTFFSIERKSGKIRWEGVNPVGNWWTGIEGVFGGILLFHGFATPDLPIHKGIFAIDGEGGSLLWSEPELRFLWCKGGIVGARPIAGENQEEIYLDLRTGKRVEGHVVPGVLLPSTPKEDLPALYPRPLEEWADVDPAAIEQIRRAVPSKIVPGSGVAIITGANAIVEYAEDRSSRERRLIRIMIAVLNRETGRRCFEATILPDAPSPQAEPFFVQDGILYYVAERSSLVAVPLETT